MIDDPLTDHRTPIRGVRPSPGIFVTLLSVAVGATLLISNADPAHANIGIPADPGAPSEQPTTSDVRAKRKEVKRVARRERARNVRERRGDNVPRYRNGRGRIAPYSIGDQWCVAFATWTWGKAGFDYFRSASPQPRFLRTSFGGEQVAIQVRDLRRWAIRTGRRTLRATPGDLVAYGDRHIGIVMRVDRNRRAVLAIEGNLRDGVRRFRIPMTEIIDYFSPVPAPTAQHSARSILRPDVG